MEPSSHWKRIDEWWQAWKNQCLETLKQKRTARRRRNNNNDNNSNNNSSNDNSSNSCSSKSNNNDNDNNNNNKLWFEDWVFDKNQDKLVIVFDVSIWRYFYEPHKPFVCTDIETKIINSL